MMLEDLDYIESIENIIRSQVNAEFAATTADNFLRRCLRQWMMHICRDVQRT